MEKPLESVNVIDPSNIYRPEHKHEELFRNFEDSPLQDRVEKIYYDMHTHQSVDFVRKKIEKWTKFNHVEMSMMEAIKLLDNLVDESDPDIDLPNSVHAFQTAERIREKNPDEDWFHLVGLIHDAGKVLALFNEPQWAVVGDTFPVGCSHSDKIVYGRKSFRENEDFDHDIYSSKFGIYKENIGLDNVMMSWGHDEYLYRVLKFNGCKLPDAAFHIIRYHSFYPWHSCNDYDYLCNENDADKKYWVNKFNPFDLYSKSEVVPDIDALMPYYQGLIDKYLPGKLKW